MDVDTFIIENSCPRFSSGDSKGLIKSTVRGYDLFFVVDVGNYSLTYNYFGNQNHMSPDDHYQDLKRLIQAASGKAHRVNVVCRCFTAAVSTAAATASLWTAHTCCRSFSRWAFPTF